MHRLKVNTDKTEYTTIKIDLNNWKKSKKRVTSEGQREHTEEKGVGNNITQPTKQTLE